MSPELGPSLELWVIDVFTETAYEGNPLAVVLEADQLETVALQRIAAEMNLSETAFPMAPTDPGADYRLRIFTPRAELPFAGHPSVGTAWLLRALGRTSGEVVHQECGAGVLPLRHGADGSVELTGGTPEVGPSLDPAPLLAAVGLEPADLDPAAPPARAGCGIDVTVLPVLAGAVDRAVPDARLLGRDQLLVVEWRASTGPGSAYARMFAPGLGVTEDPATGSGALGYAAWRGAHGLAPEGETRFRLDQGVLMGRPSVLEVGVTVHGGRPVRATVRGAAVAVTHGRVRSP